jgi:outer membrane protein
MRAKIWCAILVGLAIGVAVPAAAETKVAVIDVQRVVTDSDPGKGALQKLRQLQDQKLEEGKGRQQALDELRDRFNKQRFTLADDKLRELEKQVEDATIAMKRFQDDASRELEETRRRELDALEQRIMPIIDQIGKEQGLTLIFNKFQSGLVYADDAVDITDEVIRRFNTAP